MTGTERTIERTMQISAGRPQVFQALMDPGALSRWLFATVTLTPEPGSAFTFEWKDTQVPATAQGEILELVPDERLVLSWFMEADGVTSTASFDLTDGPAGSTRLRFVHSGLPQEREWEPRFRAVALEWDKVLLNLRFLLEERGEGKHLFYLRLQAPLPARQNRAFHAWTTPAALRAWLARDLFVIPEEGQKLTGVTLDTDLPLAATFERIEPERHLRLTWEEGGVRSLLGISFWPSTDGAVLTLTQRSFGIAEGEKSQVQARWEARFRLLESYLTRQPLEGPVRGAGVFRFTRALEATPARAWRALTDATLLRRWFSQWTDFEPREGARYTFLWNSYGEDRGRVEEVRPGESIRFTWDLPTMQEATAVTFRVAPEPDQPALCRVTLEHAGWGEGPQWEEARRAHEGGWSSVLSLLDFYLRHGAGKERFEFHLRRRLPFPMERAVPLFTTAKGLQSWAATHARIGTRVDGQFDLEMREGTHYRGRIVSLLSSGDGAAELESPAPAFLEWTFAPSGEGSQIGITLTTYSESEEWLEARRREWVEVLGRLAGQ